MFYFFDFITQDKIKIHPEKPCILYLIEVPNEENSYYIRAISSGIKDLKRDPLIDTNFYWPINNINDFMSKVTTENLNDTLFPEGELTSKPLFIETLTRLGVTSLTTATRQRFKTTEPLSYHRPRDYQLYPQSVTTRITHTWVTERTLVYGANPPRSIIRQNARNFSSEDLHHEVIVTTRRRTLLSRLTSFFNPQRAREEEPMQRYNRELNNDDYEENTPEIALIFPDSPSTPPPPLLSTTFQRR